MRARRARAPISMPWPTPACPSRRCRWISPTTQRSRTGTSTSRGALRERRQPHAAPSTVAEMAELLMGSESARARGGLGRVLEIGTGCGYQAAVLGCLASSVVSIERIKPLHEQARQRLSSLKPGLMRLVYGDGRLG